MTRDLAPRSSSALFEQSRLISITQLKAEGTTEGTHFLPVSQYLTYCAISFAATARTSGSLLLMSTVHSTLVVEAKDESEIEKQNSGPPVNAL